MVNNPSLIVADEPTGNLDPETSEAIMAMLLELNQNGGTTVIICTHDSTMVDRMKQRVIEIDDGLVIRDETASGYKGEQEHESSLAPATRTSLYGDENGASVAFGDDEEYNDGYDDAEYTDTKNNGVLFGDNQKAREYEPVEESFKPEFDLDKEVAPITAIPDEVFNPEPVQEVVVETIEPEKAEEPAEPEKVEQPEKESEFFKAEEPEKPVEKAVPEDKEESEEPEEEEDIPQEPEIIEINIPDNTTRFSFGDEAEKPAEAPKAPAPKAPVAPVVPQDLDPDLDPDEVMAVTSQEPDYAKEARRELKRREKAEKAALKEAKRKEKLDKKKKEPGTDIDMMPEDDE